MINVSRRVAPAGWIAAFVLRTGSASAGAEQRRVSRLSYTETGAFETPVLFAGEAYAADVPTEATYQFDSWRLTYRYHVKRGTRWNWWIGFTAKIRDDSQGPQLLARLAIRGPFAWRDPDAVLHGQRVGATSRKTPEMPPLPSALDSAGPRFARPP